MLAPLSNQERSPGQARRMGTITIMAVAPERNRAGMSLPLLTPHDYMAADCAGILLAFSLFSLVAVTPGYALGWLLDLLHFRTRGFPCRLALSVALSIALDPVISYFALRYVSLMAALIVYAALALFACVLFIREFAFIKLNPKILAAVLAWIVLAVLLLTDLQFGTRLYFSLTAFDYAVRTAFTHSIATFGVPALNPFYFPGHPAPLRYHYFWLIQPALLQKVGLDARIALMGANIWCGIGLISIVSLYLRFFSPSGTLLHAKRTLTSIALLAVTGLDILPSLFILCMTKTFPGGVFPPSVEWWNDQVDGFLYTMLWESHYLAGLIACLTGFLLLWQLPQSRRGQWMAAVVAGLAFATAVGAAIYVALVFAAFLLLWMVICVAKKWYADAALLGLSGAVALVASLPFLRSLGGPGSSSTPLHFTVRRFYFLEGILKALGWSQPWQILAANFITLPINYFLELGFFFAVGVMLWKNFRAQHRPATRCELAAFSMLTTSVIICTFVKSGLVANNDLGWRGFLIAQFILLIGAADLLCLTRPRRSLIFLLVLGACGTAYDLTLQRFYPLLSDASVMPYVNWLARDTKLGHRTYSNREAYEWLKVNTTPQTIIQQNPNPAVQDTFYGVYAERQTVVADSNCAVVFGGDPQLCAPIINGLTALFADTTSDTFQPACNALPMNYVVAKDTDIAWKSPTSWVWTRTPVFANDFVRLFACETKRAAR
jgi:hypothetical protein